MLRVCPYGYGRFVFISHVTSEMKVYNNGNLDSIRVRVPCLSGGRRGRARKTYVLLSSAGLLYTTGSAHCIGVFQRKKTPSKLTKIECYATTLSTFRIFSSVFFTNNDYRPQRRYTDRHASVPVGVLNSGGMCPSRSVLFRVLHNIQNYTASTAADHLPKLTSEHR